MNTAPQTRSPEIKFQPDEQRLVKILHGIQLVAEEQALGAQAAYAGRAYSDNPHEEGTYRYAAWESGFRLWKGAAA